MQSGACAGRADVPKALIFFAALIVPVLFAPVVGAQTRCDTWPAWQQFKKNFMRDDGRIEDIDTPRHHTVSEGQAYALFFALVANDRAAFEKILAWTENNLAQGDLASQLPAWWWGKRDDGSWGVLDANAASDADVWIAYTLAEAGRIWRERKYIALSRLLAKRILDEETVMLPNRGIALLPGPQGFQISENTWRLNPSYTPLMLTRRLALINKEHAAQWNALTNNSLQLMQESMPRGFAPDWMQYTNGRVEADAKTRGVGSYDAIRVYLWIALMADDDAAKKSLRDHVQPFAQYVIANRSAPEKIDTVTGEILADKGPAGFNAVAAVLLELFDKNAANELWQRVAQSPSAPIGYYNSALLLFARGYHDSYFRFAANGELIACAR